MYFTCECHGVARRCPECPAVRSGMDHMLAAAAQSKQWVEQQAAFAATASMPAADKFFFLKKTASGWRMSYTWLMSVGDSSTGQCVCVSTFQIWGFWLFFPPGTSASAAEKSQPLRKYYREKFVDLRSQVKVINWGFVWTYFCSTAS